MYACIDLGSNSFHLLIGEWNNGRIEIVERCSEKVQLGENVRASGEISTAAFQRGMECLGRFKQLMDSYPLQQYWALGTNTFRVSNNAQSFIEAAKDLGINISIISGVQEAVLIYAGVITSLPQTGNNRLIIDVGGGSTEIIVGKHHTRLLTESLAIGSVAWRDRFFSDDSLGIGELETQMLQGVTAAREVFDVIAPGIKKAGWQEVYASSGTIKMLAMVCTEHGYGENQIQLRGLLELKQEFQRCIAEGYELPGLKERRRDLLLAGWCVMVAMMESFELQTINFSATALREGMLDFMAKNQKTLEAMRHSELPAVNQASRS